FRLDLSSAGLVPTLIHCFDHTIQWWKWELEETSRMDTLPSSSLLNFLPFASSLSTMDTSQAFLTCRECPPDALKYVSIEELECHICSDHMQFFPYECEKCRFGRFPTLYAYTMHCRDEHKMTEFYVKYKYNEETERRMAEAKTRVCLSLTTPPTMTKESHKRIKLDIDEDGRDERAGSTVIDSPSPSSSSSGPNAIDVVNDEPLEHPKIPSIKLKSLTARDYQLLLGGGHSGHHSSTSSSNSSNASTKAKSMVTCQMCGISVSNQRSSLVYHANTKHIKLDLYQCKICGKNWNTIAKSDVLKHVKAVHGGDENMIIDNRKNLCNELRHYTQQCFPPSASKPRGRPPLGVMRKEGDDREKTPSDNGIELGEDIDLEQLFDAPTDQILQFANQQYQKSVEASETPAIEA
ncbi:hypothetical protein PFISCL1PPCAC_2331, partial [Pristionchus fissidentatus]